MGAPAAGKLQVVAWCPRNRDEVTLKLALSLAPGEAHKFIAAPTPCPTSAAGKASSWVAIQ